MFNRIVSVDAKTVLFGSRVRGEARQDSDWNVLVSFGKGFLLSAIATWLSVMPLQSCLGDVRDAKPPVATPTQIQSAQRWTRLDLSRITFNGNVAYLSSRERVLYHKCQEDFFKFIAPLPLSEQKGLKEIYKWVPDVVKIIASRDYQERKQYIELLKPDAELWLSMARTLYPMQKHMPKPVTFAQIIKTCNDMIRYRYPMQIINTRDQSIEDTAQKCGFEYLSKMIDFCNNPKNKGKIYKTSVDESTFDKTFEEMFAFKKIGLKYEEAIWTDLRKRPYCCVPKSWKFDLKKADTSNLTPQEYAKMKKQLKCVPPEILIKSRYPTYDSRIKIRECSEILKDTTYIKQYAKKKGFDLSDAEVNEVYQLASELVKYGTPLKLVKRDEITDLRVTAKSFGFHGIGGFAGYYERKKKNNIKIQFYQSAPEKIPYFIAEAKDFYDLGMTVNPKETEKLYQNIKNDTGIIIRHSGTQSGQMGADSRPQP